VSHHLTKTLEIKAERNLLGRLLCLSQSNNISLEKLFEYPLGPIPWTLALADGCMVKTNKSQMLHYLESLVDGSTSVSTIPDTHTAAYVIDGNAMLQASINVPETFEDFCLQVFRQLPKWSSVHFVTDSYKPDSIKTFERSRRGNSATFTIGGPRTKMPRDFKKFMTNDSNKQQLLRMLYSEWKCDKYAHLMQGRRIFFVLEQECFVLHSPDNLTQQSDLVEALCSSQEEADTRVVLHALYEDCPSSIVVRSPDTDVLVMMLYYSKSINVPFYLDTGTGNKRRLIDVKSLSSALGPDMCSALPAYHAMTGCDHTSAFVRRGKVKPLKLIQKDLRHVATLKQLGVSSTVSDDLLRGTEQFVCGMYGDSASDVNYLRHKLFMSRYDCKSETESSSFKALDGVDLSMLPPCRSTLRLHILRANYVSLIWKSSHQPFPNIPSPIGLGWQLSEGAIAIQWTEGDILPQQLVDILSSKSDSTEIEEQEDYETDNFVDVVFSDDEDEL
jgi:hypothetical protein